MVLVFSGKKGVTADVQIGDLLILSTSVLWAVNTVYTKRIIHLFSPFQIVFYPMLFCIPFFLLAGFFWDGNMIVNLDWKVLTALLYQSLVTASFGFVAWNTLLLKYGAVALHSFIFIMPIAGVALGLMTPAWPDPRRQSSLVNRSRDALEQLREWVSRHHEDHGGHQRHHAVVELQNATRDSMSPLDYLAHRLERPVLFVIMPLFALANAGVALDASTLDDPLAMRVAIAVALGLLIGKPIGITLFAWVSVRIGLADMPRGVNLLAIFATGMLAGIGFTVALFVSALAFREPVVTAGSKIGILVGSTVACIIGLAALSRALPKTPQA